VVPPGSEPPIGTNACEYAQPLPHPWEETGQVCSPATGDAPARLDCRRSAQYDRHAVLVHGDLLFAEADRLTR
jgi:hypothetical protein